MLMTRRSYLNPGNTSARCADHPIGCAAAAEAHPSATSATQAAGHARRSLVTGACGRVMGIPRLLVTGVGARTNARRGPTSGRGLALGANPCNLVAHQPLRGVHDDPAY